jgi:hypothetical protein
VLLADLTSDGCSHHHKRWNAIGRNRSSVRKQAVLFLLNTTKTCSSLMRRGTKQESESGLGSKYNGGKAMPRTVGSDLPWVGRRLMVSLAGCNGHCLACTQTSTEHISVRGAGVDRATRRTGEIIYIYIKSRIETK